jgi:hypothetical protein
MNAALIAIGGSRPKLMKKAVAAAERIGEVEVDHGETSCTTPDAAAYIRKMASRKRPAARKPARKKAPPRKKAARRRTRQRR